MPEDKGHGTCDELGTGAECEGCEACTEPGEDPVKPVETFKTQPIRVRTSDIEVLQRLKESDDETPEIVIHRVLGGYNELKSRDPSSAKQYIDQLNIIIANKVGEIKTLQQDIAERDATIEDLRGESLIVDDEDHEIYVRRGVTVNIIIKGE